MPTKTVNEITSNYIDFVEYFDCVYVDTNYILMVHDDIVNGGTRELIEQIMEIVVMNDLSFVLMLANVLKTLSSSSSPSASTPIPITSISFPTDVTFPEVSNASL